MGSKSNPFHHQKLYCKTRFFPMLCSRPSIKDVKLPNRKQSSPSFCNDPLSPTISCMGKVKRSNRIAGLTTPHNKLVLSASTLNFKYPELRRFFSARNLPSSTGDNRRRRKPYETGRSASNKTCETLSIVDLDPPLPVTKQARKRDEVDSLWKRRSNGIALQSLKLQTNQSILHNHLKPTTI